ncbi:amino acid ABC transporter substrate-binding protein [Endozoicomonas sp. OPT23]|uniref:substrate-binding periplasmic protein n=1 Tax=Endozoicomonas sp. OPT23 TaxID=2072845 RepID=UPI00129AB1A9|nr:ABC transporter substrate-binding protein [Endozoicomonas sp. OPT23]MRI35407.1 amino acid ABC transporter substrate-binding protein [Endozoicomonas sp. OPT23]
MQYKYQILKLCALVLLFTQSAVASDKLKLMTENYPPFNYSTEGKNFAREDGIEGVSVEIVQNMMERSGVDYSMTLRTPWNRIYEQVKNKKGFGVFSTTLTEEREPEFKWVGPLVSDNWIILKKTGSPIRINKLDDLKNYRIGGYKGDATTEYLLANGVDVDQTTLNTRNPKKLAADRIDLWVSSELSSPYLAKMAGVSRGEEVFRYKSVDYYLALNKEISDETVHKLQAALDAMKADGTLEGILRTAR